MATPPDPSIYQRPDPSFGDMLQAIHILLLLGYDSAKARTWAIVKVSSMSFCLLILSASSYFFPAMAGKILLAATTTYEDKSAYIQAVATALSYPLYFSLVLMAASTQVGWWWFNWILEQRQKQSDKLHAMLYTCDRVALKTKVDTVDQRITNDLGGFNHSCFNSDGIIHSALVIVTHIITGLVVSGSLLGAPTTVAVIAYSILEVSVNSYMGKPMQYIGQEMAYCDGLLRYNIVQLLDDPPPTGEQKAAGHHGDPGKLKTVNENFMALVGSWRKAMTTLFKMGIVSGLFGNLSGYVFVYLISLFLPRI